MIVSKLNESAQKCAEYMDQEDIWDHVCNSVYGSDYGVNLGKGHGSTAETAMTDASADWYCEVSLYDFSNPGFSLDVGHFTQMVWKDTTYVGFGFSNSNGNRITVAHYSPAGNWAGSFSSNVLQPYEEETEEDSLSRRNNTAFNHLGNQPRRKKLDTSKTFPHAQKL